MTNSMVFNVYQDVVFVKGYLRACVYDFSRKNYEFCPIEFCELDSTNEDFINYCQENEFGNWIPNGLKDNFLPLSKEFDWPALISNVILEINDFKYLHRVSFIEHLGTQDLILKLNSTDEVLIREVLMSFDKYFDRTKSVEILLPGKLDEVFLDELKSISLNGKIKSVIVFDKNSNEVIRDAEGGMGLLIQTKAKFSDIHSHENLSVHSFIINLPLYTESLSRNNFFNKKLFITSKGEIGKSPEDIGSLGNIFEFGTREDLYKIVEEFDFSDLWNASKDNCDVCKHCEFRYMCVDSRIPIKRNKYSWFFKQECNYNPFICKWKHEDGYKTLNDCGVISNENEYKIDHESIERINNDLWGEE